MNLLYLYFTKCLIVIQNGRLHNSPPTCQSDTTRTRNAGVVSNRFFLFRRFLPIRRRRRLFFFFFFCFFFLSLSDVISLSWSAIIRPIVLIVHGWLREDYCKGRQVSSQTFLLLLPRRVVMCPLSYSTAGSPCYWFSNCWVGPFVCREWWRRPQKPTQDGADEQVSLCLLLPPLLPRWYKDYYYLVVIPQTTMQRAFSRKKNWDSWVSFLIETNGDSFVTLSFVVMNFKCQFPFIVVKRQTGLLGEQFQPEKFAFCFLYWACSLDSSWLEYQ